MVVSPTEGVSLELRHQECKMKVGQGRVTTKWSENKT